MSLNHDMYTWPKPCLFFTVRMDNCGRAFKSLHYCGYISMSMGWLTYVTCDLLTSCILDVHHNTVQLKNILHYLHVYVTILCFLCLWIHASTVVNWMWIANKLVKLVIWTFSLKELLKLEFWNCTRSCISRLPSIVPSMKCLTAKVKVADPILFI